MTDILAKVKEATEAIKAAEKVKDKAMDELAETLQGVFNELDEAGIKLVDEDGEKIQLHISYDNEYAGVMVSYEGCW